METSFLEKQLDEFQLIRSSLLSDETFTFLDKEKNVWARLTAEHEGSTNGFANLKRPLSSARFRVDVDSSPVCFVVEVPISYGGRMPGPITSVKGDQITRAEQDRWQGVIQSQLEQIEDSEFPIYQLLSLRLLTLVHEELESQLMLPVQLECTHELQSTYHALFTSHHLMSPNKRRSLQNWSSSLSISGFAKVGYPGVIYASGRRGDVEEFVRNVKGMQWLALKVRFVEEVQDGEISKKRSWLEFQKVGEVVEEMRRLGREQYIVDMGIGSAPK